MWSTLAIASLMHIFMNINRLIWVSKHPNLDYTDCSVLCTPTIPPNTRISWSIRPTFTLISGRVPRSFLHFCASTSGVRPFDTVIIGYVFGKITELTFVSEIRLFFCEFNSIKDVLTGNIVEITLNKEISFENYHFRYSAKKIRNTKMKHSY